ncbi:Hypothetical Protein FCC1311_092142 [Hondaea fermentalgiana]|uniref:Uncharacterized protein n=1 Tax=Hondaea fermentalgiana TaxID=2315210 RepID=A0A2R5GTA4_9STRA|nr:Hypothetical Protein FCC1311_092142 [Hondaea fermentalgiana]|eukprot:GBG32988.1 Hypothetical Protein FCC1311_092142 [Hondaea fermentalgiana]
MDRTCDIETGRFRIDIHIHIGIQIDIDIGIQIDIGIGIRRPLRFSHLSKTDPIMDSAGPSRQRDEYPSQREPPPQPQPPPPPAPPSLVRTMNHNVGGGTKRKGSSGVGLATLSSVASIAEDDSNGPVQGNAAAGSSGGMIGGNSNNASPSDVDASENSDSSRKRQRRLAQTESKGMSLNQHIKFFDLIARNLSMNRRAERDWGNLYVEGGRKYASWWYEAFPSVSLYKQKGKLLFCERRGRVQLGFWKQLVKRKEQLRPSENLIDMVAGELEKRANAFPIPMVDPNARAELGVNPWSFRAEAMVLCDKIARGEKGPGSILDWPETGRRAVLAKVLDLHRAYGDGFEGVSRHFNHLIVQAEVELAVLSACDCHHCKAWDVGPARGRGPELRLLWSRRRAALVRSVLELHGEYPDDELKVAQLARAKHVELECWRDDAIIALLKASHNHTTCNTCAPKWSETKNGDLTPGHMQITPVLQQQNHHIAPEQQHAHMQQMHPDHHHHRQGPAAHHQYRHHLPEQHSQSHDIHTHRQPTSPSSHPHRDISQDPQTNMQSLHESARAPSSQTRSPSYVILVTDSAEHRFRVVISSEQPMSNSAPGPRLYPGARVTISYNDKFVEHHWTGGPIDALFNASTVYPLWERVTIQIDNEPREHLDFESLKTPALAPSFDHASFVGIFGYPQSPLKELRAVLYSIHDARRALDAQRAQGLALLTRSGPLHLGQGASVHLRWTSIIENLPPSRREEVLVADRVETSFAFTGSVPPVHGSNRISLRVFGRSFNLQDLELLIDRHTGAPYGSIARRATLLPPRSPHVVIGFLPEHEVWAKTVQYELQHVFGYNVLIRDVSHPPHVDVPPEVRCATIFICLAPTPGSSLHLFGFNESEANYINGACEMGRAIALLLHGNLDLGQELSHPAFHFPALRKMPAFSCQSDAIPAAVAEVHAFIQQAMLDAYETTSPNELTFRHT